MMEPTWQEVLQGLLQRDPATLNADERGFLNARFSYLTPEHKRIFASVLVNQPVMPPQEPVIPEVVADNATYVTPEASFDYAQPQVTQPPVSADHSADPDYRG